MTVNYSDKDATLSLILPDTLALFPFLFFESNAFKLSGFQVCASALCVHILLRNLGSTQYMVYIRIINIIIIIDNV